MWIHLYFGPVWNYNFHSDCLRKPVTEITCWNLSCRCKMYHHPQPPPSLAQHLYHYHLQSQSLALNPSRWIPRDPARTSGSLNVDLIFRKKTVLGLGCKNILPYLRGANCLFNLSRWLALLETTRNVKSCWNSMNFHWRSHTPTLLEGQILSASVRDLLGVLLLSPSVEEVKNMHCSLFFNNTMPE